MISIEEVLTLLNEYISLYQGEKNQFAIIINQDGSGQIVTDTWDINIKDGDCLFEFNSVNDMVAKLDKAYKNVLQNHKKDIVRKMRGDMAQYDITVQDLMNSDA